MAAKKSEKYPHRWSDGTYHSISEAQHLLNTGQAQVAQPPPGTYDPNLDAQLGASNRGLKNLIADTTLAKSRAATDLGLGETALGVAREQSNQDYTSGQGKLESGYQRNLSDLLTSRAQGAQDYGTSVQTLDRNYANLAGSQAGAQRKAGAMAGSGAAIEAAQKRTANQATDRAPIDTAYQRFIDQSRLTEGRLGEDRTVSLGDLLTAHKRSLDALDTQGGQNVLNYDRGNDDLDTALTRGKTENTAFGLDTANAKLAQFLQNYPGATLPTARTHAATVTPGTVTAGPGIAGTKRKRKGNVVTYSNTVGGP